MAVQNCEYLDDLLPDAAIKYGLVSDIEVDSEGYVHAPEEPGLGYEIAWDLANGGTTRVLR
jgi:L-alanine-DL-glutamate epimerase-like enolase superfamily enzyme